MSLLSLSMEQGGLIVDSAWTELSTSPEWYPLLPKSDVHHIRLLWMPRIMKSADKTEAEIDSSSFSLVSPSFSLGKNWLKANLIIAKNNTTDYPELYLKVLPEHETQILGRVMVSTVMDLLNEDEFTCHWDDTEQLVTKLNVDGERGWYLEQLSEISSFRRSSASIRVVIEVVILDEQGLGHTLQPKLSDDFRDLRMEQNPIGHGADIVLQIGTTQLRAHKFVLSARSPVLKTMLNSDTAEARFGVIELKQMSVEAAKDFIGFVYSGQIDRERLVGTAAELLQAADLYDMPDLLAVCESTLRGLITANNTAQFLILAAVHNAKLLKADVLAFLASNKSAVTATEEWADAKSTHCKILLEAILEIV